MYKYNVIGGGPGRSTPTSPPPPRIHWTTNLLTNGGFEDLAGRYASGWTGNYKILKYRYE